MDQKLPPNDNLPDENREWKRTGVPPIFEGWWIRLAFLLGIAGLVFAPVIKGQFIWDDLLLVERNPLVTGKLNLLTVWFHTDFPLSIVALWLQYLAWGANPLGYHVINLLLHAGSALMLYSVLKRLNIPGALLAAIIFLIHPVCAGSAGWISELKNTLSTLLFFISLWCFLGVFTSGNNPDRTTRPRLVWSSSWYWWSLVSFLLALLAKTSTVMLPFVILLAAWYVGSARKHESAANLPSVRAIAVATIPFFLVALVFGFMTIWFQVHQAMADKAVQTLSLGERTTGAFRALLFYFDKAIWPVDLSMLYPKWSGVPWNSLLRVLLFLAALGGAARWLPRLRMAILFGLGFFVLNLLPILGFVDMYYFALSPVSDHLQYLALPGICTIGGSAFTLIIQARAVGSFVGLAAGGVLAVLGSAGFLAYERSAVLAMDESVWRDTLSKNPGAWLAHNNLGCILAERQDYAQAEQQFLAALQLNPKDAQANCNYGRLLALKGDLRGAEQHFRSALDENSRDAEILKSFASTLMQQGRAGEALSYLRKAVEAEPSPKNRLELANALQMSGATKEAIQEFKLVLDRAPDSTQALNNLAWLMATARDPANRNGRDATRYAERACKLTQRCDPMALGTLACAYAESGRFPDAVRVMEEAVAVAEKQSKPGIVTMGRQLLDLFKSGKPYRQ